MRIVIRKSFVVWLLCLVLVGNASGQQHLEPGLAGTYFEEIDFTRPVNWKYLHDFYQRNSKWKDLDYETNNFNV